MASKDTIKVVNESGPIGYVLFFSFIGAAVYFVQQTSGGFWEVILAILKAMVWPAFLMYSALAALSV